MSLDGNIALQRDQYNAIKDDKLLILIKNKRDRTALAGLFYQRYRHSFGSFLRCSMRDAKLINEVYNDLMMTIWPRAGSFRGEPKFSRIFAIVHRQRMPHFRNESKHEHIGHDDLIQDVGAANESSPLETIQAAMTEFSESHRTVIELIYFHGYSTKEIVRIVNCILLISIKTRLFHARKTLKTAIEADHTTLEVHQ